MWSTFSKKLKLFFLSKNFIKLIEKGVDIHAKDEAGNSPLHLAICRGLETTALKLIEHGADILTKNDRGASAMHYAVANGCKQVLKKLFKNKVPPFSEGRMTISPIEIALIKDDKDIERLLLQEFLKHRITTIDLSSIKHLPQKVFESIKPKEGFLWEIKPYLQNLNKELNLSKGTRKNPPRVCRASKD